MRIRLKGKSIPAGDYSFKVARVMKDCFDCVISAGKHSGKHFYLQHDAMIFPDTTIMREGGKSEGGE